MRKFYMLATLMFVLAGCDKPVDTPRHKIGFASQMNRSIVEGVDDLKEKSIKLFGTAILDGEVSSLFNGEELYYDSVLGDWDYADTRYWIPQAEHRFFVVWPYQTDCTFSVAESTVVINHTATAAGADLLYTTATRNLAESDDYSAVPLTFRHGCAALQFNIINASDRAISSISNIYLVGLKNKGKFTFGIDGSADWVLNEEVVAATDHTTFGGSDLTNLPIDINTKHPLYADGAILVLPQEILNTDVKLHLEIKKAGSNTVDSKDFELGKLGGSTPIEWEIGKRYEYTMTVTENTIVSNVKVVPWIDHYVDL
jgi:hypothetical protein